MLGGEAMDRNGLFSWMLAWLGVRTTGKAFLRIAACFRSDRKKKV